MAFILLMRGLKQYKKATLFFSCDAASIASIIPAMDKLNSGLNPLSKHEYHPAIKATMRLAHAKMNRYYSITDNSSAYQIAMGKVSIHSIVTTLMICGLVLHLGLKLEYFRLQEWEDEWIDVAENLVREEYINAYENRGTADNDLHGDDEVGTWLIIDPLSDLTVFATR
jgi:hypothetical protein